MIAVQERAGPAGAGVDERRRIHRGWWVLLLAVLGLAGLFAAVYVGTHPALSAGSTHHPGRLVAANDGIENTRYVVPDGGARLITSIRNDDRFPVTVALPDPEERRDPYLRVAGFQRWAGPNDLRYDRRRGLADELRLAPGEEVHVAVDFGPDACIYMTTGSYATMVAFPVLATKLGVTGYQEVPLPLPVTVVGRSTPQNHPAVCGPVPEGTVS